MTSDDLEECFGPTQFDENLFPLGTTIIAQVQWTNIQLRKWLKANLDKDDTKSIYKLEKINSVKVVTKNGKIMVPSLLQTCIMNWYHHWLQHPGMMHMEQTLQQTLTWKKLYTNVQKFCWTCKICQLTKKNFKKNGHLLSKEMEYIPWHMVCVNLIGSYTIKSQKGDWKLMCLTMIDPATSCFKITEVSLDNKSLVWISQLFNDFWLSCYPRPVTCIYDNGGEFKLHFKT